MTNGQRGASRIQVWTPAKLNLYLEILARRPDGFHELDTVMTAISLYDSLFVRPNRANDEIVFSLRSALGTAETKSAASHSVDKVSPDAVPADASNLVVRAAKLLQERSKAEHGADIQLVKRIPVAAGLGGASSDAAATLTACNVLWQLDWSLEQLAEVAAELGSDIPFFIYGGTATCRGRGEIIHPLRETRRRHFVVAKPPVGLSTADVYRNLDVPAAPKNRDIEAFERSLAFNRLQPTAEEMTPWIERLQEAFIQSGAKQHGMSGSGTSYFAVCNNVAEAIRIRRRLQSKKIGRVFYAHGHCHIRSRLREPSLN